MSKPYLSIVIPAFNEAHRIGGTLEIVREFMQSRSFPSELLVVDDGSTDEMRQTLADAAKRDPNLRVLENHTNRGKGFSVRRGVLEARGKFILFTDADLSTPIEEADKLFAALENSKADAAIGSRAVDRSLIGVRQPWFRDFGGRGFNLLVRAATGLELHDTQCGFKLFRRETTRRAFELQQAVGFGFDPEVLFLIERLGGKIVEVPVRWANNPATKVRLLRDPPRMLLDLVSIRWRAARGKYGI